MKRKTLIILMGEDKSSDHGQNEQKQLSTSMKFSEIWPEERKPLLLVLLC